MPKMVRIPGAETGLEWGGMIDEDILRRFGTIWPRHVHSLMTFLIQCRRDFDGDVDLFLVMCIIGDRSFSIRNAPPDLTYEGWNGRLSETVKIEEINIQSVADFSGIPRETVRRKLNDLIAKGWVTRDGKGYIAATSKAKKDLEPLTVASLRYLSAMKATLLGAGNGAPGNGGAART